MKDAYFRANSAALILDDNNNILILRRKEKKSDSANMMFGNFHKVVSDFEKLQKKHYIVKFGKKLVSHVIPLQFKQKYLTGWFIKLQHVGHRKKIDGDKHKNGFCVVYLQVQFLSLIMRNLMIISG